MIIVELFSGTESFSKVARERGHQCFTVDMDISFNPDLCIDILNFDISMLPGKFKSPDFIWASPPCTTFSVASIRHYWENGKPKKITKTEIPTKTARRYHLELFSFFSL